MKKGMGKRIISLGAAFCLCAGLCACSGSGASTFLLEEAESSPAPEEEGELRYELGKIYIQTEEILPAWLTGPTVQWTSAGDNRLVRLCYDEESNRIMVRWENYVFGFYEVIRYQAGYLLSSSLSPGGRYWTFDRVLTDGSTNRYTASLSTPNLPAPGDSLNSSADNLCADEIMWSENGLYRARLPFETSYYKDSEVLLLTVEDMTTGKIRNVPVGLPFLGYSGGVSNDGNFCHLWAGQYDNNPSYVLISLQGGNTYTWEAPLDEPVRSAAFFTYEGAPAVLFTTDGMIGLITGLSEGKPQISRLKAVTRPGNLAVTQDGSAVAYLRETGGGMADLYLCRLHNGSLTVETLLYRGIDSSATLSFNATGRCLLLEYFTYESGYFPWSEDPPKMEEGDEKYPALYEGRVSHSMVIELK